MLLNSLLARLLGNSPLRLLLLIPAAQSLLRHKNMRGAEWLTYPIAALVAWRTYSREHRRHHAADVLSTRDSIRDTLLAQHLSKATRKRR